MEVLHNSTFNSYYTNELSSQIFYTLLDKYKLLLRLGYDKLEWVMFGVNLA